MVGGVQLFHDKCGVFFNAFLYFRKLFCTSTKGYDLCFKVNNCSKLLTFLKLLIHCYCLLIFLLRKKREKKKTHPFHLCFSDSTVLIVNPDIHCALSGASNKFRYLAPNIAYIQNPCIFYLFIPNKLLLYHFSLITIIMPSMIYMGYDQNKEIMLNLIIIFFLNVKSKC